MIDCACLMVFNATLKFFNFGESLFFLLCAEILGILVKKSWELKGITIDDTEYRLSQYADV